MALTNKRTRKPERISALTLRLTNGEVAYQGGVAALVAGKVVVGAAGAMTPIGFFAANADASGGETNCVVNLPSEIEVEWLVNDTVSPVLAAHVGGLCFVKDDNTVTADGSGNSVAGRVWKVDATKGVAVELLQSRQITVYPTMPAGDAFAFVAGAVEVTPESGAVYEVPTTTAASVITLNKGTLPDGSWCEFVADGTANGHTVQYADKTGPVNLTTALTASKRHHVKCVLVGGIWFANAYVSP